MRKGLVPLAAGLPLMAGAAPAFAEGARFDVHTGLGWADGRQAKGEVGAALGYDIGTGGGTFVGLEESIDKVLASGTETRFGTAFRAGAHVSPNNKLYALAGYSYGEGPNATHVGGGLEHDYGKLYTKVEYRHYFTENGAADANAATVGVGLHF